MVPVPPRKDRKSCQRANESDAGTAENSYALSFTVAREVGFMSKKKKSQDFNNSPFKNLKGLSLPAQEEVKAAPSPSPREVLREYDFSEEMKELGVKILPEDERLAEIERSPVVPPSTVFSPAPIKPRNDKELFLSAIEGMEVIFHDEIPDLEVPTATPRRLKLVEQGRLCPNKRLDLHGFSRSEARRRAAHFLEDAVHNGYPLVLIITGWGKHGSGEAILR
ncbi:MAG: Smr/MutS family protein, partial [Desulfuromonadales bacterium]|nr:Smr/MutS family protein [Desulfuromonadales bacterium]